MVTCLFFIKLHFTYHPTVSEKFELLSIIFGSGIANYMPVKFSTIDLLTLVKF